MRLNCSSCWLLALSLLAGLTGSAQAQARFSYSTHGSEVTDSKTGLIWQRCSAGQHWSGSTCTGTATAYTHEAALTYAQNQTGWRLPNAKELSSLMDRTVTSTSIDSVAFPATSSGIYWSTTPSVGKEGLVKCVYSAYGIGDCIRGDLYSIIQVRLVR